MSRAAVGTRADAPTAAAAAPAVPVPARSEAASAAVRAAPRMNVTAPEKPATSRSTSSTGSRVLSAEAPRARAVASRLQPNAACTPIRRPSREANTAPPR